MASMLRRHRRAGARLGILLGISILVFRKAAERHVTSARTRDDGDDDGTRHVARAARTRTVQMSDGTGLHVSVFGPEDADVTIVLAHGWTLSSDLWIPVVDALSSTGAKVVIYDHRGHGRSDSLAGEVSLHQLGHDLGVVLDEVESAGPAVLVGHSMGGMAIMHLAAQRPELFEQRIQGVVFVSTSLGELDKLDFGLPTVIAGLIRRAGPPALSLLERLDASTLRAGKVPAELWLAARRLNFGLGASAIDVDETLRVARQTRARAIAAFYAALMQHDGHDGTAVLRSVPASVVVGAVDRLTPVSHGRKIADKVDARMTVVPGAGHMVILEQPTVIAEVVRTHLRRAELAIVDA